jgi:hypothetical protein
MLLPLTIAFLAVALGAALAILPREGALIVKPIRLIALIAALVVIATHLVPEALEELGPRALLAVAAGIALPWILEALGGIVAQRTATSAGSTPFAALEISYAGLVVHRFGDGLSMGAIARSSDTPTAALGVLLALAAHIVPVTTVMVLAFVSLRGRGSALFSNEGRKTSLPGCPRSSQAFCSTSLPRVFPGEIRAPRPVRLEGPKPRGKC